MVLLAIVWFMKRNLQASFDKFPLQSANKGPFTSGPMILNNSGIFSGLNKSLFLSSFSFKPSKNERKSDQLL